MSAVVPLLASAALAWVVETGVWRVENGILGVECFGSVSWGVLEVAGMGERSNARTSSRTLVQEIYIRKKY